MARSNRATKQDLRLAAFEALIEKHGGRIGPRTLLDAARNPDSPFHDQFEWDDKIAGEQYRLAQASQLIRQWKGVIIKVDNDAKRVIIEPVRRVQSPASQRAKGVDSYETVEALMADPVKREAMMQTVLAELESYRKRYAELEALADVWRAIDDAIELHRPRKTSAGAETRPAA
jgi:hypothetical protein